MLIFNNRKGDIPILLLVILTVLLLGFALLLFTLVSTEFFSVINKGAPQVNDFNLDAGNCEYLKFKSNSGCVAQPVEIRAGSGIYLINRKEVTDVSVSHLP